MTAATYAFAHPAAGRLSGWHARLTTAELGRVTLAARYGTACGGWVTVRIDGLRVESGRVAAPDGELCIGYECHGVRDAGEAAAAVRELHGWLVAGGGRLDRLSGCGGRSRRAR